VTWFAFRGYNGGKAVDIAGSQEKEAAALGFHGYATEALAEGKPNSVNVFNSWAVNEMVADYKAAVAEQAQPGGKNASNPAAAGLAGAQAAAKAAAGAIPGLAQIGDFFQRITQGNTWLRIGEGLLGIILIAVGLAHMTRAVPIATSIASKVP
jgi:hypothetical protein